MIENETYTIAVVTPVYNTVRYLKECLDSFKDQRLAGCRFLMVDDGSTDGSKAILERYAESDSRFIVISQTNQGAANARNRALEYIAQHPELRVQYVCFADSDDRLAPGYLDAALAALEKAQADCILCGFKPFTKHQTQEKFPALAYREMDSDDYIAHFFGKSPDWSSTRKDGYTSLFLNNRIFRWTSIVNVRLDPDLKACEDQVFIIETARNIKKCVCLPIYGYFYRKRRSSLSNLPTVKQNDLKAYLKLYDRLAEFNTAIQKGIKINLISTLFQYAQTVCSTTGLGSSAEWDELSRLAHSIDASDLPENTQKKLKLVYLRPFSFVARSHARNLLCGIRNCYKSLEYFD